MKCIMMLTREQAKGGRNEEERDNGIEEMKMEKERNGSEAVMREGRVSSFSASFPV